MRSVLEKIRTLELYVYDVCGADGVELSSLSRALECSYHAIYGSLTRAGVPIYYQCSNGTFAIKQVATSTKSYIVVADAVRLLPKHAFGRYTKQANMLLELFAVSGEEAVMQSIFDKPTPVYIETSFRVAESPVESDIKILEPTQFYAELPIDIPAQKAIVDMTAKELVAEFGDRATDIFNLICGR